MKVLAGFAGWALLAEYFIAVAFVGSGLSANFRGLRIQPLGIQFPKALANPLGTDGGVIDITSVVVILMVAFLLSRGASTAARVQNTLVVLKVLAVLLFIVVGATALHMQNYVPFIPAHKVVNGNQFGGWQGIYAGVSMISCPPIGFDSVAANSAEARGCQKRCHVGSWGH